MKKRVVILGAGGFVGSHIAGELKADGYEVVGITRKECDFAREDCAQTIRGLVQDGDIVVCASAKAPAKNLDMLFENVAMISAIAEGLRGKRLAYVLNISSDAVYADVEGKLNETSAIAPLSAHGIMHCMREHILEKRVNAPIGHLRPTLIYGAADPHNGYGPNSFLRLAREGKPISLFGNGEEQRDHIFVGDVAALAVAMIKQQKQGTVNAVTGKTISFMDIAQLIREAAGTEILTRPRSGPMPHNGYRAFDNAAARALCPDLQFKDMRDYIAESVKVAEHVV